MARSTIWPATGWFCGAAIALPATAPPTRANGRSEPSDPPAEPGSNDPDSNDPSADPVASSSDSAVEPSPDEPSDTAIAASDPAASDPNGSCVESGHGQSVSDAAGAPDTPPTTPGQVIRDVARPECGNATGRPADPVGANGAPNGVTEFDAVDGPVLDCCPPTTEYARTRTV